MKNGLEREVVILMTDMVQYSRKSLGMKPEEIRDFLIQYHGEIHAILYREEHFPLEIEPSAGDGCLVIFEKRPGEDRSGVCTRALQAGLRIADAISRGDLAPTRMWILLGRIIEAQLGTRMAKFGASFAVANRLEELCGHFGTHLLMDREVAKYQQGFDRYLVSIAKVSLTSVEHPINIFTLYIPGLQNCPTDVQEARLLEFIRMKNQAMEYFGGNQLLGIVPDFPRVREELLQVKNLFRTITGREDLAIERILALEVGGDGPAFGRELRVVVELDIELHAADAGQVVLARIEEHAVEELRGGVERGRVAGAQLAVDFQQRFVL